jgi:hypothetical protein
MAVKEYSEQLLAVQQWWLLQNTVSNCWLCNSNGCYRMWWATACCAAVMDITECMQLQVITAYSIRRPLAENTVHTECNKCCKLFHIPGQILWKKLKNIIWVQGQVIAVNNLCKYYAWFEASTAV